MTTGKRTVCGMCGSKKLAVYKDHDTFTRCRECGGEIVSTSGITAEWFAKDDVLAAHARKATGGTT